MSWGWVRCLACNTDDEHQKAGAVYKDVKRTKQEIAHRAALADQKAEYKPEQIGSNLMGIARKADTAGAAPPPDNTEQLNKLISQVTNLTEQISELLTENRALRKKLEEKNAPTQSIE